MEKKRLLPLTLILALIAALLSGCVPQPLTLANVQSDPWSYVESGALTALSAWAPSADSAVFYSRALQSGELTADLALPSGGSLCASSAFGGGRVSFRLSGSAGAIPLDDVFYLSREELALRSALLLGSNSTYGLNFHEFFSMGPSSMLAKEFGLTGESFESLRTFLESSGGDEPEHGPLSVLRDAEVTVAETTFPVGETDVPALSVTAVLSADSPEARTAEDALSQETGAKAVCYLSKSSGILLGADLAVLSGGATPLECRVTFGDGQAKNIILLHSRLGDGKDAVSSQGTLTRREDGIEAVFQTSAREETAESRLVYKDADGSISFTSGSLCIDGSYLLSEDSARLTVDRVTQDGEAGELSLAFTLTVRETPPEAPVYTNLLSLSDDTAHQLFSSWKNSLVSLWGSAQALLSAAEAEQPADSEICTVCQELPATQTADYLGESCAVCDTCADILETVKAGSYCDSCWTELPDDQLIKYDLDGGVTLRLCSSCLKKLLR